MNCFAFLSLLLLAFPFTGCDVEDFGGGALDHFKEDFHLSYPLKPGGVLTIDNLNGSVEISSWEKDEVEVNGVKYCISAERLRGMRVEGTQSGNRLTLRSILPEGKRSGCGAKYTIRVPKKITLDGIVSSNGKIRVENIAGEARLQTSNGGIQVRALEGKLDARTSNASIDLDRVIGDFVGRTSNGSILVEGLEGSFSGATSNASIKGRIAKLKPNQPLKAETSNGSIDLTLAGYAGQTLDVVTSNASVTLRLPAGINADLRASTSNGSIECDLPISETGIFSKTRLEGKLGQGGNPLRVSTSNGGIRIRKL
jgi:DUF4097 and DUF4098 domain-containing protein YvlB